MTTPSIEPPPAWDGCVWPVDPACMTDDWDDIEPEIQLRAQRLMTEAMRMLTGYVVGGCPVTVRPCATSSSGGSLYPPIILDGAWIGSCGCSGACFCEGSPCEVELPAPVGEVLRVLVDGEVVDAADYQIQNGNVLTWIGTGDCPWPRQQNVRRPDSEPGTFSVTYLNAYPVDANGAWAGGIMAMEFARACKGQFSGNKKCRLPSTVRSVARAGLTYEIPAGAFPDGLTGIREVDTYLQSVKPNPKAQYASAVYSPDRKPPRVVPTSVPLGG